MRLMKHPTRMLKNVWKNSAGVLESGATRSIRIIIVNLVSKMPEEERSTSKVLIIVGGLAPDKKGHYV